MVSLPGPELGTLDRRADEFAIEVMKSVDKTVRQYARGLDPLAPSITDLIGITPTWARQMDDELLPLLSREYQRAATEMYNWIADFVETETGGVVVAAATDVPNAYAIPRVEIASSQSYLAASRIQLAGIGDELMGLIYEQLSVGLSEGESIDQLAARIRTVTWLSEARATLIARTESIGAANRGALAQMMLTGLDGTKTWLATHDGKTRPTHQVASGQEVSLRDKFIVGGVYMDGPHDLAAPPRETARCRCALTFSAEPSSISTSNIATLGNISSAL